MDKNVLLSIDEIMDLIFEKSVVRNGLSITATDSFMSILTNLKLRLYDEYTTLK